MYSTTVLTFFVRTFDIIRLSFALWLSCRSVELVARNVHHFCGVCANYVSDVEICIRRSELELQVTVELLRDFKSKTLLAQNELASKR
jgi:hypothetical protein